MLRSEPQESKSLVRLRNAAFGYGNVRVLERVNLELRPADFLGILGPNGAGKSTLLKGMLGLSACQEGEVDRRKLKIGYVPQRGTLDPVFPLSVAEVVYMGASRRLSGWRRLRASDLDLAMQCLERVGLSELAQERFASLSGGQMQRVLFARALLMKPELLLLDEPTAGVDRPTQAALIELLRELNQTEQLAILFVTHDLSALQGVVEELLWVSEGAVTRCRTGELPDAAQRYSGLVREVPGTVATASNEGSH